MLLQCRYSGRGISFGSEGIECTDEPGFAEHHCPPTDYCRDRFESTTGDTPGGRSDPGQQFTLYRGLADERREFGLGARVTRKQEEVGRVDDRPGGLIHLESSVCSNQLSGVSALGEIPVSEIPSSTRLDWEVPNPCTITDWKAVLQFGYRLAKELDLL